MRSNFAPHKSSELISRTKNHGKERHGLSKQSEIAVEVTVQYSSVDDDVQKSDGSN